MTEPPSGTDYVVLRMGDSGYQVELIQRQLAREGYYTGSITGNFDAETHNAVLAYQTARGLHPTGIADRATQRNLFEGDYPNEA